MGVESFVGRHDAVKRLQDVLTGRQKADGKLTVQSIEGPGGIGKTCLFEHAIAGIDLSQYNYLTLRIDGNGQSPHSLVRAVARMVDGAKAAPLQKRPPGYYFPSVDRVVKAIESIRREAETEFKKMHPENENGRRGFIRCLDTAFDAGKRINQLFPITKTRGVNCEELEKLLEDTLPKMKSLRNDNPPIWEELGIGSSNALKNAIKENACRPLADAMCSDLSAILVGYQKKRWLEPAHAKIKGIDRLLLILDDYEMLQETIGEFLVGHLLDALKIANFQSLVVILGRDRLEATHVSWAQHYTPNLLKRIELAPLSQSEMDQLVEFHGLRSDDDKERAWYDTQGYPYYVQLWIEEIGSGGRSAIMLKRFYDRTTRWMNDREKMWLEHALFLDDVNIRTLREMLGDHQEAKEAFKWFQCEGSVRDTSGSTFRVREYLRSRLIDYLRISDPDRCEQLQPRGKLAMNSGA